MQTKINFANGTSVILQETDSIQPISLINVDGKSCASLGMPSELYWHVHDGLIPSLLDVLLSCDFFKIVGHSDAVYGTKTIVSIENI